jgi:uncharacterized protein YjbI with pentapeptide repeats
MKPATLKARWGELPQKFDLRAALAAGTCQSPFGSTEQSLCDYRGIVLDASLHKIPVRSVDFSYAVMGLGQFATDVSDCLFRSCRFDGALAFRFENCDFSRANLGGATLHGSFIGCNFSQARLQTVRGTGLRFERCVFEDATLTGAAFYDSVLLDCSFIGARFGRGSLAGSQFLNCTWGEVDFKDTVMQRVVGIG